ncbi:MAG TPA: potassium-transporting ATPase subunit KdpC [Bacteroidota bacterium]|nr:potassium-transporting ATPase subunit KdpC [Bacteroidota bacterium]
MKEYVFPALRVLLVLTILTGVLYPVAMTLLAQWMFPQKANGSMVTQHGTIVGSELIGQKFMSDRYFHARPSAIDYNPLPSGGSNFAPTSKALQDSVHANGYRFIDQNKLAVDASVPKEMLFASGSGLDPHISPEAANLQMTRIANVRRFNSSERTRLNQLVCQYTEAPQWNVFGQPRVNVFLLNLALDQNFNEQGKR